MRSVLDWMFEVALKPRRASYDPSSTLFVIECDKNIYVRKHAEFKTSRGLTLTGGFWTDKSAETPASCLIYLHSLGSNQFEAINLVPFLCSTDLAVFSFDFSGSGLSDGDVIPLVGNGTEEVFAATEYLRKEYNIHQFGLWGRSMGAAIAMDAVSLSNDFACIVSDSSYYSVEDVAYDQAGLNGFPVCVVKMFAPYIKKQAAKLVGPNFDCGFPKGEVMYAKTPLLMGHGKKDTFVPLPQAQKLFNLYGFNDKQLYIFEATHNTSRPIQWYETASRFIIRKMGLDQEKRLYGRVYGNSRLHVGKLETILEDIEKEAQETEANRQIQQNQLPRNNEALSDDPQADVALDPSNTDIESSNSSKKLKDSSSSSDDET